MTFTDAKLLAALVALAIPVLVHLWGRRRARRMVLPTVRFAEAAHQASRAALWLKRAALLALRLAAVALLVLALAGPHIAGDNRADQKSPSPLAGEGSGVRGQEQVSLLAPHGNGGHSATAPIRVLIVDADPSSAAAALPLRRVEEAGEGVNSADLVAATFTGDTNIPKQVTRAKSNEIAVQDLSTADVVFWTGTRPHRDNPIAEFLGDRVVAGGALVLIPGSAPKSLRTGKYYPLFTHGDSDGVTLDPNGYTSDLLAAFEGGTSGDLSAPVFRRRLAHFPTEDSIMLDDLTNYPPYPVFTSGPRPLAKLCSLIRFHDRSTAIAEWSLGRGRVVALAFGPDPYWGDLAGRPEFVVLMHSLAEALGPKATTNYPSPLAGEGAGVRGQGQGHPHPASPPSPIEGEGRQATDLTLWFVLALAVVLAAESLLAAASATRSAPASPPITKAPPV